MLFFFLLTAVLMILIYTKSAAEDSMCELPEAGPFGMKHDLQFGGLLIDVPKALLYQKGFAPGDSVDVRFDNGYTLKNVPFYTGFYTKTGMPLLCTYRGYDYPILCINNGEDLYTTAGLADDSTVTLLLNRKAFYLPTEEVMNMGYSRQRSQYASDEIFSNFRVLRLGRIRNGLIFRSASPSVDEYCRASCTDRLMEKHGIRYCINLADDEYEIRDAYLDDSIQAPYWKKLYEEKHILPLNMSFNYRSDLFACLTADAMRYILVNDGPFLVHCTEGKDRTGFFCLLLGILAGATRAELEQDYMESYRNYYRITLRDTPAHYDAVLKLRFFDMLLYLCDATRLEEIRSASLVRGAKHYLIRGGMSPEEIEQLILKLVK